MGRDYSWASPPHSSKGQVRFLLSVRSERAGACRCYGGHLPLGRRGWPMPPWYPCPLAVAMRTAKVAASDHRGGESAYNRIGPGRDKEIRGSCRSDGV